MLFNSFEFAIFFPIVTILFFLTPHKLRWLLLLLSSCVFYMYFKPEYILILALIIVIDYVVAIKIEAQTSIKKKNFWLILSLVANIGVLAVFKYYNFINNNITALLHGFNWTNPIPYLSILLPVGLSFHTFQAMSYTIEVYRGNQPAERNFGIYSLYVMFYPQLVAGPIERPQNLLHQFYEKHSFDYQRVSDGLKMMIWGLFKKLVIADRLAIYVNSVYGHPDQHTGLSLLMATVFFSFQIYCDFSAYSEIAIGAAKVMGFKLMTNFNRPYFSKSIAEFWKRWHISLSTWFKDYLYISLGGNKVSIPRWYFNLFFVFLVSGLWHGANWTFIIWGALNGFYLVAALLTKPVTDKIVKATGLSKAARLNTFFQILITFLLASFAWIFFRANTVSDAFLIVKKIATFKGPLFYENLSIFIYCLFGILFLLSAEFKKEYYPDSFSLLNNQNRLVRHLAYATLILLILVIGVFDGGQFIYFQF